MNDCVIVKHCRVVFVCDWRWMEHSSLNQRINRQTHHMSVVQKKKKHLNSKAMDTEHTVSCRFCLRYWRRSSVKKHELRCGMNPNRLNWLPHSNQTQDPDVTIPTHNQFADDTSTSPIKQQKRLHATSLSAPNANVETEVFKSLQFSF